MPDSNKHYITIFMMGDCVDALHAQPENLEPNKCQGWDSYSLDQLHSLLPPSPANHDDDGNANKEHPYLFGPLKRLVEEAPQKFADFMSGEMV
jgi:8-oxo-dGTP diphosphatase